MAVETFKGTFTCPTSTGSQALTGFGFQPKLVFFWVTRLTSAGYGTGASLSFGVAASSTQEFCISACADNAAGTMNTGRNPRSNACIYILSAGTPTTDGVADFTSMDADGCTINWSDAPGSAWLGHVYALGGDTITNVAVGNWTPSAGTGNKANTGPGFTPNFVMELSNLAAIDGAGLTQMNCAIGMFTGASNRVSVAYRDRDGVADADCCSAQRTDQTMAPVLSTANSFGSECEFVSFDANGYTINVEAGDIEIPVGWVAIAGGDHFVGSDTQRTSTGTEATTGVGFEPMGLFFLSWGRAASASVNSTDDAKLSIFAADADLNEGGCWWSSDDGAASSNVDTRYVTTKALGLSTIDSTTNAEADLTSMDADGFTLDWTTADATAREFLFWAVGPAEDDPPPPSAVSFLPLLGVG